MAENVKTAARPHWNVAPCFIVDDVVVTANFYRDKLGFNYQRFWGEPPCFTMVRRGGITIMLNKPETSAFMHPNGKTNPEEGIWDAYIWVEDADALYEEFQRVGVRIAREICNQPYGCRDFDIEDCNGYRLCFGQDLEA
ncbi:MAG TPA: VOC family protein [Silvibacterium sp.]|jgi:predicted enzyme related to lactoylglutathione lyase|nr:VOC family protein [Silvibacterium sp.]